MAKIRILPEQLANQIAAGEVVERPASVVKELVENSLDAKASRIEIEIEGGGTRLIRIIDNGVGMDEDDLLLSLERHGTSKIVTEHDLAAISTLGFRGEAIPSIGSVAQLTITSRPGHMELGTRVVLHYGKLTKVHETGCSYGTTCEVRNLFGNTPARRKFLRTVRTELGHIDEVVKNFALGSPAVTFIERIDGREVLALDGSWSLEQRLGSIMHYDGAFIPLDCRSKAADGRSVSGFLVPPEKVTVGPAKLRIFVNGRSVRDRMIVHAVTEGMRGFLMKGKNPSGLVHLHLPAEEVDVNVHPAKHEVRFRNGRDIHVLLGQAVAQAIMGHQQSVKMTIFGKDRGPDFQAIPLDAVHSADDRHDDPGTFPSAHDVESAPAAGPEYLAPQFPRTVPPAPPALPAPRQPLLSTAEPLRSRRDNRISSPVPSCQAEKDPRQPAGHNLLVIGQYDDLYIFCRNSEGLLVIDQHAAHERLLYEKLRKQFLAGTIVRQNLLFPETVELSLFQTRLVEKNHGEIDKMGFSIREFGGNTYIISAIPALAGTANPRELFLDILERFGSESSGGDKGGFLDTILASMACKAAVKAGTTLTRAEIDKLLDEMARADLFSHCPHGRPVLKQFSRDEIKKWFYRT
jgi:DNA mismatch repair protein MutL